MFGTNFSMPFGAEHSDGGVRFRLWAPSAKRVDVVLASGQTAEMTPAAEGFFEVTLAAAEAGARYQYRIDGDMLVPDPASRFQPDGIDSPGEIIDASLFPWSDTAWRNRPWSEAVVWEAHVGTATAQGTYTALAERIGDLSDLGITAIELMPLADTIGDRNWGYDGVLPFAPNNAYGTPDELRAFVDRAHAHGIMVLIDVVYNHFGPAGNYLHAYAGRFFNEAHQTPWGAAINFDGEGSRHVRDFYFFNAMYWLEEFHMDGIRFDAVHAFVDESERHFLDELASRIRAARGDRPTHLILENEHNAARWLGRDSAGKPSHYTAQWNDDIHHCFHVLLTGETEAYYEDFADAPLQRLGRCLAEGFAYQGDPSVHQGGKLRGEISAHLPPDAFVSFTQNHDQVGNRAMGERLSALASAERLDLAHAVLLLTPQIPMLFMGEEWSSQTPFLFFVDFASQPDLSNAVREGRRKEFARFAAFNDPQKMLQIPDPTSHDTFLKSKLDWSERSAPSGARKLAEMKRLIGLRHRELVPLMKSGHPEARFEIDDTGLLHVSWIFPAGSWSLIANFSDDPVEGARAAPGETIFATDGVFERDGKVALGPWSAIVTKDVKE